MNEYGDMTEAEAIAYLTRDGGMVPCSRYGRTSEDCAPIAYALDSIVADATGEPSTIESLEHSMGLVVNDHDDVRTLIRDHGSPEQRALIYDVLEADMREDVERLGAEDGRNAAAWWAQDTIGGRATGDVRATARTVLAGIDDLDPAVMEALPHADLSGQWADGTTVDTIADAVDWPWSEDSDLRASEESTIADTYCETFDTAAQDECERLAREALEDRRSLPDTPMYRAMAAGHLARFGHALRGYLVDRDGSGMFAIVRECCEGEDHA